MTVRRLVASVTAGATVLAQLAPVAVMLPLAAPAVAQSMNYVEIQCYAEQGRQNSCPLPPGTRSVSYKGPDRSMRCREGQTWRKRGNSLWVANGCGGIFEAAVQGGGPGGGWGGSGGSFGGGWGGSGGSSGGGWGGSGGSSGGGWGGSGGTSGGGWGGSGGEITCRSIDNREKRCRVNTGNRVTLLRQLSGSPCIEGQTWRYDRNSIWVRDGCQAVFAYGSGSGWGGGGSWGRGFAGEIRCRSSNQRYSRCPVRTDGRVEIVEKLSKASCVRGQSWGYDAWSIWVNRGCEARFAYGRGNYQPQYGNSGGSSSGNGGGSGSGVAAGLLGAGLAAGLIAILNARGHQADTTRPASSLQADYGLFPAAAQLEAKACMAEASRQLGHSGATGVRLDRVVSTERRDAGWHLIADVTGTWPRESNRLRLDCTAVAERVTAFDVRMP